MNIDTQRLIQQIGLPAVIAILLLILTTVLLKILAVPLAAAALALDRAAAATAGPIAGHAEIIREARYR